MPNRWWTYHRMANAGRIQIGRLIVVVPMRWHPAVRDLPGYGFDRKANGQPLGPRARRRRLRREGGI